MSKTRKIAIFIQSLVLKEKCPHTLIMLLVSVFLPCVSVCSVLMGGKIYSLPNMDY